MLTWFIAAPPNGSSVWVRTVNQVTGAVFEQEITADLPANMQFLSPRIYLNTCATAFAFGQSNNSAGRPSSSKSLRGLYAVLPNHEWHPYGQRVQHRAILNGGSAMLDIIYIGLGLGGFALFALAVRSMERM